MASARADVQRAERIFGALLRVRPDRAFAPIGLATALLNAGRAGEAMRVLHPVAARGDNDHPGGATQGARLARRLLGQPADADSPTRPPSTPHS